MQRQTTTKPSRAFFPSFHFPLFFLSGHTGKKANFHHILSLPKAPHLILIIRQVHQLIVSTHQKKRKKKCKPKSAAAAAAAAAFFYQSNSDGSTNKYTSVHTQIQIKAKKKKTLMMWSAEKSFFFFFGEFFFLTCYWPHICRYAQRSKQE